MSYRVNEVFLSVQGEGPDVGLPVVFVRFSGCNLDCPFCDTSHEHGTEMDAGEIEQAVLDALPSWVRQVNLNRRLTVVFTGGEPLLQLDDDLVMLLGPRFRLAVETNGDESIFEDHEHQLRTARLLERVQQVVVSPKTSRCAQHVVDAATAIKVLVPFPSDIGMQDVVRWSHSVGCKRGRVGEVYLQPVTPADGVGSLDWKENCEHAIEDALELFFEAGIQARVLPQVHVLMEVR